MPVISPIFEVRTKIIFVKISELRWCWLFLKDNTSYNRYKHLHI